MASPSETSLIVITAAAGAGILAAADANFWTTVTAIGLTVTPVLAAIGRRMGRARRKRGCSGGRSISSGKDRTVIFGFGRVGQMVADMLVVHDKPYLAVDSDVDGVRQAREAGYKVLFGDVRRPELADQLHLGHASALVLTMDDPVLVAQLARRVRGWVPNLPIIARARDTGHAAQLYKAGVTDAVPEAARSVIATRRGRTGRCRRADGPGDRQHSREASGAACANHGRSGYGDRAEPGPAKDAEYSSAFDAGSKRSTPAM